MNADARDVGARRVVVWIIAVVLIVGVIVGIGTLRDDDGGTSAGDAATTVPAATSESTATTPTIATTTIATTTIAPTTTPTTATPATYPTPQPTSATVDLAAAVETLEPEQIATFPIAPPGDLFPTAYATTTPDDRIAILDDVTGVVRFIDGTTRMDIAQYPTSIPTIGSQSFVAGYFLVGPDDVFYLNESGDDGFPSMVAYARSGDSYIEVARVSHGIGDSTLVLGRSGVSVAGVADPIMPYVGVDGQPSGATLDLDQLNVTSETKDVYTVDRAGQTWNVTYVFPADAGLPTSDVCVLCPGAYLGPNSTVVLVVKSPTTDGDLQTKLTLLSDAVVTYDTNWNYIGTLDGKMLFDRLDQDSIDIGTVEV
ncbi:MAG: hypothetical protein JJD93_18315 [Ilumatobacteraceae bacterium]|nr:hypothetical protein [Ilumatobacteraceae bacterium]